MGMRILVCRSQICSSHVIWIRVHLVWNVTDLDAVLLRLVQQLLAVMMILPECRWDVMWQYRNRREVIWVMVVGRRSTSGWSAYAIRPIFLPESRSDVMRHHRSRREVIWVMVVGRRSTSGWSVYAIRPIFLPECRWDVMSRNRSRREMSWVMVVGRRSTSGWSAYSIRPYWTACSP